MKGMTTQERYDDICRISGMTEEVVRRVLGAEKISIKESLKRGERATLIGRCTIRPEICGKIVIGGKLVNYIKLKSETAQSLNSYFEGLEGFILEEGNEEIEGIRLNQIPSLV